MKNLITILLAFGALQPVKAQNKWENCSTEEFSQAIMDIERVVMDKSSYSYNTDYLFYDQTDNPMPIMQESALLICEKGETIYIEQFGKTIIQDKTVQVEVDPVYKTIVLRDPLEAYLKPQTASDFAALEMPGASVKKKMVGDAKMFYISFPDGNLYVGAEVTTGGAMGITKYVLYAKPTTIENEDGKPVNAQPRMEVTYKNFQKGDQAKTNQMKHVVDYVSRKGDVFALNLDYQDYELIDLRSQPE